MTRIRADYAFWTISWLLAVFLDASLSFSVPSQFHYSRPLGDRLWQNPKAVGKQDRVRLFYSSGGSKSSSSVSTDVLYQRVIRPSANLPDFLFLGYLVEYLEGHFQLPNDLPMIYETSLPSENEKNFILAWDSPLSPSKEATRMEVEVVGIFTDKKEKKKDNDNKTPSVPNMAMVVVKKSKSSSDAALPPMMKGLFDDSERKIIKSLDFGLQDFEAGKVKFREPDEASTLDNADIHPNIKTAEEAIQAELVDELPTRSESSISADDVVLDAQVVTDETETVKKPNAPAAEKKTVEAKAKPKSEVAASKPKPKKVRIKTTTTTKNEKGVDPASEDFAVAAARRLAKKKKKKMPPIEDFAVAAARKVGASTKKKKKSPETKEPPIVATTPVGNIQESPPAPTVEQSEGDPLEMQQNFRASDYMGDARAFKTTISHPKKRNKQARQSPQKVKQQKTQSNVNPQSPKASTGTKKPPKSKIKGASTTKEPKAPVDSKGEEEMTNIKKKIENTRKLNVNVVSENDTPLEAGKLPPSKKKGAKKEYPTQNDMEIEVMKAAQKVMGELAEQGEDMTPEELLKDILKFGEEQKKEETPGRGFVSGAFEKAKELMKEGHRQRQERLEKPTRVKERTRAINDILPDIVDPYDESNPLTEEEEMRQMFQAGERIADGRITKSTTGGELISDALAADPDVDRLMAEDKSISSYARVLDDELAELELSINPSPGEELDGPPKNPVFDVMSGPEVYDRNVDPDTVNYPGALPGTRDVRLPKQLDEAIKQSNFAVEILKNLRTEESSDEHGTTRERFFMGKKEMTKEQVQDLKDAVAEAVEIGLIPDPLDVAEERSRLQMVLDEMWTQPPERYREIASNYKDLMLSENFVNLIKERLTEMADRDLDALRRDDESLREPHAHEREILGQLVGYAQLLLKEARALGAELEAQQLEVIRSICKVAMDPSHKTEEETAMALSDAVRDMRPLLDDMFVAYLKYAVAEEEGRLARAGLIDDPEHNQWLFVLKIVQQGVYAEIAKTINRYVDHIGYVLRMETPSQRKKLLGRLIDDMPTMDVRPFVQVVENIAGSLGDGAKGEFDGIDTLGDMANVVLQLRRDVHELLPPERIALKARDADEWAARQREKLMKARHATEQRLQAARETEHLRDEIEALGRQGEMERFD